MAYNYPYGNGQQLNLDWFLTEWKNLLAAWEAEKNGIEGALQAEIDRAEAALADVFAARDAAAQSAANALESKNAAAQSASDASGYLATVRADANTASNAARNAAQSESNAAESAQTALASKNAAGQSERNAAQSEANALDSKNAAAQSAADALAHKDAAVQSASDAAASAKDAEDVLDSIPADYSELATEVEHIADIVGAKIKTENVINVDRASMNASDTKTLIKAAQGDTIVFNASGDLNITSFYLYFFNESNQSISQGNTTLGVERTIIAPFNVTALGVYFVNATYPSTLTLDITVIPQTGIATTVMGITAKVIPSYIADTALTVNDFRIVDNTLYRITSNIASGASLIPDTNCSATTVGDVLKSLLS